MPRTPRCRRGSQPAFSQQGVSVRATLVKGALPADDPTAAAWATAAMSEFPMSPQVHWPTRITEVTAKSVKVRGLHDGTTVAILLEYSERVIKVAKVNSVILDFFPRNPLHAFKDGRVGSAVIINRDYFKTVLNKVNNGV